mmetsp:Transcript_157/g.201  ORF Transcript_157/g.201 Transcript_157/m.201 type:complete len:125 (-) Transcript_157:24-398(-)
MSIALRHTYIKASLFQRAVVALNNQINSTFPSLLLPPSAVTSTVSATAPSYAPVNASPITINDRLYNIELNAGQEIQVSGSPSGSSVFEDLSTWLISTLKRRKKKMNKHKLRKRRKMLKLKNTK